MAFNVNTGDCTCYDVTLAPPPGGHHSWCPCYEHKLESFPEFLGLNVPDYTPVLERIAFALEAIREKMK